jgi:short-subunit dehydrogenase
LTEKQVVFITGASSGIGRATALAFAKAGYHVAGTARRTERLEALRDDIASLPDAGDFLPVTGDVTDAASMQAAVTETLDTFGRLDVLVANAGVGQRGALVDSDWSDLQTLLRTNIDGVLHSIRACVPAMRQNKNGGHILTISSVAANLTSPYAASYAASKAFVSSIANSLRLELEDDDIHVTDVLVGRTQTEFNEKRLGEGARRASSIPTMSPAQVAQALVKAVQKPRQTIILRWFDRLIVLANKFFPGIMGRLARRQYK